MRPKFKFQRVNTMSQIETFKAQENIQKMKEKYPSIDTF